MKKGYKILLTIVIILVAIPLIALAAAYFGVIRPALPQLDGELALDGLSAPVTVYWDANGIPNIVAENAHDLFFAQGFVHAQDRLWAMESSRRAAHGTLSEVTGERGLKNDVFMRTLGMTEAAEANWDALDADAQASTQAYADGVNAYLALAGSKLPLEFRILGLKPEPWTPIDSLVFGKLISWGLSNNYRDELAISQLSAALPWEEVLALLPDYAGPEVIPDANGQSVARTADALLAATMDWQAFIPLARPDQGSNAWVVGGSHTASGAPLLANDPHQGLSMPSSGTRSASTPATGRTTSSAAPCPACPAWRSATTRTSPGA